MPPAASAFRQPVFASSESSCNYKLSNYLASDYRSTTKLTKVSSLRRIEGLHRGRHSIGDKVHTASNAVGTTLQRTSN